MVVTGRQNAPDLNSPKARLLLNSEGFVSYLNNTAKEYCGASVKDLLHRHIGEIEREGIFTPSLGLRALKTKRQEIGLQKTRTGRDLVVIATPIFQKDILLKVICTSIEVAHIIGDLEGLPEEGKRTNSKMNINRVNIDECIATGQETHRVFSSRQMRKIAELVIKVATADTTCLVAGESGVGKEVIARLIHELSPRGNKPLIAVNCGAIPAELVESELFGYVAGAFTGAKTQGKNGLVEAANGGTLLLDEISEMPMHLQVKLLRFLQEKEYLPVGSTRAKKVDVRIVASTNVDLEKLVNAGKFRNDLYFRLNVIPIFIPPLRERQDEIPVYVNKFLLEFNENYNTNKRLTNEALNCLCSYHWPGNIRELRHLIERLVLTCDSDILGPEELPTHISGKKSSPVGSISEDMKNVSLKTAVKRFKKGLVEETIQDIGSIENAASLLEIDRSTIYRILNS